MRLKFSHRAEADLEQIADYVAQDSPNAAFLLVRRLRDRCEDLLSRPHASPLWSEHPEKALRRRVVGNYLIFYMVEHDTVHVTRISHGARDLRRLFDDPTQG